jgi:predicted ATPase/transcriptional regulator with XRE-family HTH domain
MTAIAAISPVALSSFGDLLRFLRRRARLQQRDLAIAVGYSESQICRLEQNQRLPDLTTLAALFVPALDLDDQPELAAKLLELAAAARSEKGDGGGPTAPPAAPIAARARASLASAARQPLPSNLPTPLTPLVDRTSEVGAALALLGRSDLRLLTLVGPPGIGKTRLGLRIASEYGVQQDVQFVPLAAVRDPALVLPTIAHALGAKERADLPLLEALRAALCDRRLLLALDNFEQVLPAAADVAELLRAAPNLKVLVTSRAALHLSGEHLLMVPPLALPDLRALPPIEVLARYPAIELFLMRVQAVNPGFVLSQEHARTIAEICVGLDGLPLAIELAAARSRLFTPRALLDRLRCASGPTALQFLVGGPRDLLAHQQTLRGTLDWSYELLGEHERRLLMHLSLFAGGGTAAAIAVVSGELQIAHIASGREYAADLDATTSTIDGLLSLVDQSLVRYDAASDVEPRFSMLETIREYAREKLEAAELAERARRRYIGYYLALAYTAERELNGAQQERWFRRLEQEYDNLCAVLRWLAEHNPGDGLRLATSLRQFWPTRGYLNEGRRWLEALLRDDRAIGIEASVRARALCVAGYLAYHQGDLLRAQALSQASLALSRPLGERRCTVDALLNLGGVAYYQNDYARAAEIYAECLALYRQLNAPAEEALVLKNLGLVAKDQGDFGRAKAFFEESLAIRKALGDKRGVAQALFSLGLAAYWQGDYAGAAELSEQCVVSYGELGDQMGAAYALDNLGMAVYKQADFARAADRIAASLRSLRELGDQVGIAMALTDLGTVVRAQGDRAQAARLHAEALAIAWRMGDKRRLAFCLEGLAFTFEPARFAEAAQLLGAAEALRKAIGAPLPQAELADYERGVAAVQAGCLDTTTFDRARAAGRERSLDDVIQGVVKQSA